MCTVTIDMSDVENVALQQAHAHSCYSQYNICQWQLNKNVVNCSNANESCQL